MRLSAASYGTFVNVMGMVCGLVIAISDYVRAQRSTQWSEGSLRLVGGQSNNEGTVLIYHWSRWGAICDDYWDLRDANVVCNEMGFPGAKEAPRRSRFGKGRRRVWLSGLHCRGNERHLTMCYSRGWGNSLSRCTSYWSSAGVICNPKISTTTPRTTTTTKPPTTTTERPTTKEKTTTTTTTTTPKPVIITKTTTTSTRRPYTSSPGPTTPPTTTRRPHTRRHHTRRPTTTQRATTSTTRRPTTTAPREYNRWVYNREMWRYYMYFRDGTFITSRPDPRYYRQARNTTTTSSTTTTTTTTTTPRPVDLSNQILNSIGGENDNARQPTYDVISNEIGEPQEIRHLPSHNHRHHNRKEGYVQDQPPTDAGIDVQVDQSSYEQLPDTFTATTDGPSFTDFRITGGRDYRGYKEGRIEVRLAGSSTWGVICGDNFDIRAAIVVCRHFNAGAARTAHTTDHYGGSDMDKVVASLRCTGKEDRIEDCTIETHERTPGAEVCSRPQSVAGVICDTKLPDLEPDTKAIQESAFLRDRYLYYLQCAYEEGCLASSASDYYGTSSWAYATRRLLHFSTIAKNIGTADFRPDIDRSRWEWHACHQHYHSMEAFSHYDIIDSHGNKVAEGHKASFCLEDSSCNRGVFPRYNCQGFGHQGISVGCQDSYLADIDCQWIDVTDVKPGYYTLKVELNPNMKVPELNFDNNVAKCDLYFNTREAKVSNCVLASLLS